MVELCMECGKQARIGTKACTGCGSRNFIKGDGIKVLFGKVVCICGESDMKMVLHINRAPEFDTTYECECGRFLSSRTYSENYYE